MSDDWVETTLGDVVSVSRERVDPRVLEPTDLVHYSIPVLDATNEPALEASSLIQSHKFKVSKDSILVSLLNPRIPRVWLARGVENAVCSTEFAVLSPKDPQDLSVEFLHLLCQADDFWIELQKRAVGSTGSRQRAKVDGLLGVPIALPPLPVQRRIVDLLAHLDNHLANLQTEREALTDTRNAAVRSHFTAAASGYQSVGSLLSIRTGKLDVNQGSENGPFPFFTCSREVHRIDWADFHGEAVIVAGNGDLNVRYFDGDFNAYQRTYVLQPLDTFTGNLKYIYLFFEHHISTLRINSSGSVIKYIKLGDLRDAQIPDRSRTEQEALVDSVFATDRLIDETDSELMAIRSLRSHLLSALLSGSYSISDQYDDLLSEVV